VTLKALRDLGPAAAVLAVAAVLGLAGCGSDKESKSTTGAAQTSPPVATAPSATTPPPDATVPATGPDAVTTSPESQQGGAGDEEGVRVQASILLDNNKVVPTVVKVPAFLPIELVVVSVEGVARRLTVATKSGQKKTFAVPALGHKTFELPGLPKGDHPIYIDGKPSAKLDVGSEPGP
jgi:hypothetical protein